MESTLFPYGTVTSEADVKTNRMRSTKWNYHTERSVSSNYSILLKNLFQFKNFLKRVDLMYQLLQCTAMYLQFDVHIRAFRKRYLSAGVLFERAFSHWVSLTYFSHKYLFEAPYSWKVHYYLLQISFSKDHVYWRYQGFYQSIGCSSDSGRFSKVRICFFQTALEIWFIKCHVTSIINNFCS